MSFLAILIIIFQNNSLIVNSKYDLIENRLKKIDKFLLSDSQLFIINQRIPKIILKNIT